MKKYSKIGVAAMAVLVIGVMIWRSWSGKEPEYKGTSIREYLYSGNTSRPDKEEAFKFFGTKAIPYVRAGLRARETWDRKALLWVKRRAPWLHFRVYSSKAAQTGALYAYATILEKDYWGEERAACALEVRDLLDDSYSTSTVRTLANNIVLANVPGFEDSW
jgi:hypothetical protein